ncbi:nucleotidyl transferase AbiEii/AbiGii toxin family protein [Arthrobacter polaris]|uniref:nucleotidyl transferase AbiEii/AbiGii toxin family protein n=1 Tax=Arthrobacter polaris TaxID=2813727 RepID=UPI001F327938|nr:nucleotidyl transferase AbiEii/AbiGii toxin family protein [Arthrobacter polaris]UIK88306.1 nucleotidyl transferase AbiEii/AbiGii toxin family protein [Arthrobacter polaris]
MTQNIQPKNLASSLSALEPKTKAPTNARVLDGWISRAQDQLHTAGPRLGWLVASTVVIAALQRAVGNDDAPLFLLKGGTMLQYRLSGMSRTTTDVDGLVRGEIDEFLTRLDAALQEPWGPLTLERSEAETIIVPHKIVKPRRFDIKVSLKGKTWRKVKVEIAADEGEAGAQPERIAAPTLAGFGLPAPETLASISLRYQIAQKIHAASDPHDPPRFENDRARDVVDLLLLRELCEVSGSPSNAEIRDAVLDVFNVRAKEAIETNGIPRPWPVAITAHQHWTASYNSAAKSADVPLSLPEAVENTNGWLKLIDDAHSTPPGA